MKRILLRIFLGIIALVLVAILSFIILLNLPITDPPAAQKPASSIFIQNASVVDLEGDSIVQQSILIENGRISNIGSPDSIKIPRQAELIDASGKFIIPGLWDMHTHLMPKFSEQLTLPLFLASGVTNIRELGGGDYQKIKGLDQSVRSGKLVGPRIQAIGAEFVNSLKSKEHGQQVLDRFEGSGHDFVKIYNAVLPEYFFPFMEEANKKSIKVLGHKPRAVKAIEASRVGFKSFEHARLFLFECYPGAEELRQNYHARYTGKNEGSGRLDGTENLRKMVDNHSEAMFQALVDTMIAYDTWFCPTHITRKMDAFADNEDFRKDPRLKYMHWLQKRGWMSDADGMVKRDPSPEGRKAYMDFYQKGLELTGKAHRAGLKILAGTDANDTYCFPGLSLHDELQELVEAGLSPVEALRTATVLPAEYFGMENEHGSIASGKIADLILLDANPLEDISNTQKIDAVIFNGAIYNRETLDKQLKAVEKFANTWNSAAQFLWEEMN